MGRLFNAKSKRMLLVTMDHGICVNPIKEIGKPKAVVRQIVESGTDVTHIPLIETMLLWNY